MDEDEDENELNQTPNNTKKNSFFNQLVQSKTKLLIVTVVVGLGAFALFNANIFSFNSTSTSASNENTTENEEINTKQLSTNNSEEDASVVEAVKKTSDAIVGIVKYRQSSQLLEESKAGTGSGVIYKKENGSAYVVTNQHVIEGSESIDVILSGGKKVQAEVVGSDPFTDLAVLKVDGSNVNSVAEFGSSKDLHVGETAIAIGNPLGMKFAGSVTKGIISGLDRTMPVDLNKDGKLDWKTDVLQTDAAINPGNSGGALINLNSKVIGINSMKIAKQKVEGIGFAIPTSTVKPIIKDLEENGEVTRPFMGIQTRDLSSISTRLQQEQLNLPEDVESGVVIAKTQGDSPADQAGLQKYDVLVQADGNKISSLVDLRKYIYEKKEVGEKMKLTYYREGEKQTTPLTLGK
ncbi:S1C family serine protease [Halobacillus seohaensis]|uniref:S1C family serine protease n=1 Tax=Halobacillus seohaensis TaxID=447421 RepID=A0ABW2ESR7_9BACI